MATATISFISPHKTQIGKTPVVVLPIKKWTAIEYALEELAMLHSKQLQKEIARSRKEAKRGQVVSLDTVETKLRLA